ncbi:F0F1 ATP synthase subunit delta [Methylocaldum sp.]|uniref:F0F1 ATP synthase subunit delta n=1 Tax=Methylocaldum sp. TaxID=1969727 RepID=UPI002D31FE78|nr:F0F1 ATP synthase subunit delta [Methylocaldum sp.]HYE34416.1 F0F1 ATP synthase subunit delta [Methylocaldum sp.]
MNFDWTTFVLEFVNFIVLLWILRRFLYRPVLEVIQARQRKIEDQLRQADRSQMEALAAKEACERNMASWEKEKALARMELEKEIAAERQRLLARLTEEESERRAKQQAQEERERQEWMRTTEQQALELGSRFVVRLLERLASSELEARLISVALGDLGALPKSELEKLRSAMAEDSLEVSSGYPMAADRQEALAAAIGQAAGSEVNPTFKEDPSLLAGLRMHAGSWVLSANLRDELKFFRDVFSRGAS